MRLSIPIIASLLSVISALPAAGSFLTFNPPTLSMSGGSSKFMVSLAKAPNKDTPAIVTFNYPGLRFSVCSITFTNLNFAQAIEVQVSSPPNFGQASTAAVNVLASVCAPGTSFDNQIQSYSVSPVVSLGGTCVSQGDPHYSPFNGAAYDYQGIGAHYLFKHDKLTCQNNLFKWNTGDTASWNDKFAIRYGTSGYVFVVQNGSIVPKQVSAALDHKEITITSTNPAKTNYDIELGDGSKIILNTAGFQIDTTITLAPGQYTGATGLCYGSHDMVPDNDNMFNGHCTIPQGVTAQNQYLTCTNTPVCVAPPPPPAPSPPPPTTSAKSTVVSSTIAPSHSTQSSPVSSSVAPSSSLLPVSSPPVYTPPPASSSPAPSPPPTTSPSVSTTSIKPASSATIPPVYTPPPAPSSAAVTTPPAYTPPPASSSAAATSPPAYTPPPASSSAAATSPPAYTPPPASSSAAATSPPAHTLPPTSSSPATSPAPSSAAVTTPPAYTPPPASSSAAATSPPAYTPPPTSSSPATSPPVFSSAIVPASSSSIPTPPAISSPPVYTPPYTSSVPAPSTPAPSPPSSSVVAASSSLPAPSASTTSAVPTAVITPPVDKPGCNTITDFEIYNPQTNYSTSNPTAARQPIDLTVAAQRCGVVIADNGISQVPRSFYVDSCAKDYAFTGAVQYAEAARQTYNGACRATLEYQMQSTIPEERVSAQNTADATGLGATTSCPGGCGSNGSCLSNACSCNAGFLGSQCQFTVSQPSMIQATSIKASSADQIKSVGVAVLAIVALVL